MSRANRYSLIMKAVNSHNFDLVKTDEGKVCSLCLKTLPRTEFHKKGERLDSQCKCCVKQKKATKRKMTKLSKLAKEKTVIRLIELKSTKVFTTTATDCGTGTINLEKLVCDLVEDVILNHKEKDIA
jgi:hypothetical protein